MNHVLLVGAGFSRNWNGWLAAEVKDKLYGRLSDNPELSDLLRRGKRSFEEALTQVQAEYKLQQSFAAKERLDRLQGAILDVFGEMNRVFDRMPSMDFSSYSDSSVEKFLSRFDVIFTLNQDLLLELRYINTLSYAYPRWLGRHFPGMQTPPDWQHSPRRLSDVWYPMPDFNVERNLQPIFKLHGSINWRDNDAGQLLVMGANKETTIQEKRILNWYKEQFKVYLERPDTRLMVIGYGFLDDHINEIIHEGWRASRLKMLVVDPSGLDVVPDRLREIRILGVSTRPLRSTFCEDELEHAELMRFFA